MSAAAGAVVVGDDDERLRRIDWFGVITKAEDALAIGLRHVYRVGQAALDHVEVVAGKLLVDEFLRRALHRVDAIEQSRCVFEPPLQLRAVDLHRGQRVRIEIQIRGVVDRERPGCNVRVIGRTAETGLERRCGG